MITLKSQLFAQLDTKQGLLDSLQIAIQLEHATIPTYLYALYSIAPGKNEEIADLVQSVVKEEMLHMALVCNILNALGGSPLIDDPTFVPNYPGPLPGSVASGLIVPLAPLTIDLVKNTFMEIEEPEHPLEFKMLAAVEPPKTIGQFYAAIKKKIIELGDGEFVKPPRNQVTRGFPELFAVTDVKTASDAIDLIVEQGEGTTQSPRDLEGDYAHYYRFAEIYRGKRLVPNPNAKPTDPPDSQYLYAGAPIPFDSSGVFAVPTNPKAASYPAGSAQRHACDTFNYTYTSLLKSLHAVFNGQPDQLRAAMGLMFSLRQLALDMMSGTNTGGKNTGPSFEYQPVNPA